MNKLIAVVALVVFLALAGMVAWQSASQGSASDDPPRRGTRAYYDWQREREATERAIMAPLTNARLCLAEDRPADCRD